MKLNFFYLLLSFNLMLFSCGGDEEIECVIPASSFSITIDGELITEGESSGDISNTTLGGYDVRYVDMYFAFSDGRTFTIGVQNLDTEMEGVCLDNRNYDFDAMDTDCFSLDQYTTICNESDILYENSQGDKLSDFVQVGSVTITDCNLEKGTISGSFSGTIGSSTFITGVEVSGEFTDILITE